MGIHSLVEWSNCPIIAPPQRAIGADFAAHGRPGLSGREQPWSAPEPLAAVQSSSWLRPATLLPPRATTRERQETKPDEPAGRWGGTSGVPKLGDLWLIMAGGS